MSVRLLIFAAVLFLLTGCGDSYTRVEIREMVTEMNDERPTRNEVRGLVLEGQQHTVANVQDIIKRQNDKTLALKAELEATIEADAVMLVEMLDANAVEASEIIREVGDEYLVLLVESMREFMDELDLLALSVAADVNMLENRVCRAAMRSESIRYALFFMLEDNGVDLPPVFVPLAMLVRQAQGECQQGAWFPEQAACSPGSCEA